MKPPGKPVDPRKVYWARVFHLSESQMHHQLTGRMLDQLDRCQDDAARRLLIYGIGNLENPMVFDVTSDIGWITADDCQEKYFTLIERHLVSHI